MLISRTIRVHPHLSYGFIPLPLPLGHLYDIGAKKISKWRFLIKRERRIQIRCVVAGGMWCYGRIVLKICYCPAVILSLSKNALSLAAWCACGWMRFCFCSPVPLLTPFAMDAVSRWLGENLTPSPSGLRQISSSVVNYFCFVFTFREAYHAALVTELLPGHPGKISVQAWCKGAEKVESEILYQSERKTIRRWSDRMK